MANSFIAAEQCRNDIQRQPRWKTTAAKNISPPQMRLCSWQARCRDFANTSRGESFSPVSIDVWVMVSLELRPVSSP
jgi:hypothetical protein